MTRMMTLKWTKLSHPMRTQQQSLLTSQHPRRTRVLQKPNHQGQHIPTEESSWQSKDLFCRIISHLGPDGKCQMLFTCSNYGFHSRERQKHAPPVVHLWAGKKFHKLLHLAHWCCSLHGVQVFGRLSLVGSVVKVTTVFFIRVLIYCGSFVCVLSSFIIWLKIAVRLMFRRSLHLSVCAICFPKPKQRWIVTFYRSKFVEMCVAVSFPRCFSCLSFRSLKLCAVCLQLLLLKKTFLFLHGNHAACVFWCL